MWWEDERAIGRVGQGVLGMGRRRGGRLRVVVWVVWRRVRWLNVFPEEKCCRVRTVIACLWGILRRAFRVGVVLGGQSEAERDVRGRMEGRGVRATDITLVRSESGAVGLRGNPTKGCREGVRGLDCKDWRMLRIFGPAGLVCEDLVLCGVGGGVERGMGGVGT